MQEIFNSVLVFRRCHDVAGATDEGYVYDADGLRIKKTEFDSTYSENFDDGNIYDGNPTNWYTTGSYWDASTGELRWTSTGYNAGQCSNPDLTFDDFVADYDLMADGYYQTNYWAAFAFRKSNYSDWYSTSGYMVYYRYNGEIELYEAGVGVLVDSQTGKDLSTWRHVKIVASGSNIKVYVDGNLEINYDDSSYTSGYFGFNVFGVAARYDNLVVKSDEVTYYIRGAEGEVLAEYDVGDNLLNEYAYANGQRIASNVSSTGTQFYLNDHLGSARVMVGNNWSANYYPYGEMASQTGSTSDTRFDFTGQERDQGTGLMYFGARYYDPQIGRWLSVDPLAEKHPEWSPYNYVLNNPMILIDPDGKQISAHSRAFRVNLFDQRDFSRFRNDPIVFGVINVEGATDLLNAIISGSQNLQESASGLAILTAPIPPAAAISFKISRIASMINIGTTFLKFAITSRTKEGVNVGTSAIFLLGTETLQGFVKKLPSGKFAGKLTDDELKTLTALIEGSGGVIQAASQNELVEFIETFIEEREQDKNDQNKEDLKNELDDEDE